MLQISAWGHYLVLRTNAQLYKLMLALIAYSGPNMLGNGDVSLEAASWEYLSRRSKDERGSIMSLGNG